jgi:IS30 family transposase
MKTYKHLALYEREKLYGWKMAGVSISQIAKRLGRNKGTVSRELDRHTKYGRKYLPCLAQRQADKKGDRQRRREPLKSPAVFLYVRQHLRNDQWSPETIAGRLPIDYPGESIHFETIYRYIYRPGNRKYNYRQYLTLKRNRRMKLLGRKVKRDSRIPNAISIDLRSKLVLRRRQPGHWETDNMEGIKSDKTVVSVTTERVARLTLLSKLESHKSKAKIVTLAQRTKNLPVILRGTITADNGPENTNHQQLTALTGMAVFFCHPYHAWEKGTVENTVGRIRRYFPKGESLEKITPEEIAWVERKINSTPRKCLQYLTPYEMMQKIVGEKRSRR